MTAKHFYIFRHGECPFNLSGHIQGQRFNGSLTEHGKRQALMVGLALQDKQIDVIVSSPMRRAVQTAQLARHFIPAPILIDNRFIEVNMGIIEGMHISVAEQKFAALYKHWRSNNPQDAEVCFENGETKAAVRRRIFAALNHYALQTPYQNIAVSGHGITISQTLLYFGVSRANIPNGSILSLRHDAAGWQYDGFILI